MNDHGGHTGASAQCCQLSSLLLDNQRTHVVAGVLVVLVVAPVTIWELWNGDR